MDTDGDKDEERIQLNRQHLKEWNDQLDLEVRSRIALDKKHKNEHKQAQLEEVNFLDRAALAKRQVVEIRELSQQNRLARIAIRKRHTQECDELNRPDQ